MGELAWTPEMTAQVTRILTELHELTLEQARERLAARHKMGRNRYRRWCRRQNARTLRLVVGNA